MAKWHGNVGYSTTSETAPGVWSESIILRPYYGDLNRNIYHLSSSDKVNDDINVNNEISIVADAYAFENFQHMKFVEFMGATWKISSVEVRYPRLVLTVGGVYNAEIQDGTSGEA